MSWYSFKPYVSVAKRRENAAREMAALQKKGRKISPVHIEGQKVAKTFWGKAWCDNLESYSDFASRLPRGRSYVRNGSVCDLQIEPGRVTAMVCGSEMYEIEIGIKPLPPKTWTEVKEQCAGQIGSLIELLRGKLSASVMQIITRRDGGLFPKPSEIELDCSCPDWADMCKHVAAALYGVGARLDEQPELLFVLRKVNHLELIEQATDVQTITGKASDRKRLADDQLSDVFGIELEAAAPPVLEESKEPVSVAQKVKPVRTRKVVAAKPRAAGKGARKKVAKKVQPLNRAKPRKRTPSASRKVRG